MISRSDVVKISIVTMPDEIDFAAHTAELKSKRANTANTWQKGRNEFRKFTDLFPGDLAKNIVRNHASENNIALIDYDKVRTDNFLRNDQFDLKHGENLIEVKSSLEKIDNAASALLGKRRFMVYADRSLPDFVVQVYFVYDTNEGKIFFNEMDKLDESAFKEKYEINNNRDFVNRFISFSPAALIMWFITKREIEQRIKNVFKYKDENVKGDESRSYVNVFIKEGIPFSQFHSYLI